MKWVWRFIVAVLLMIPVAVAGVFFWLRTGVPTYDRTVTAEQISAPVQIMRDDNAVPHIFAANDHDAYFALGYIHAQDRLWQMDMQRRIGAGRLAEIVGPNGVRFDRFMRTMGFYQQAQASWHHLSDDVQQALQAYADGVNTWIDRRRRSLPPEYLLLRTRPERWRPADTLVWGKIMAVQLSSNYRSELLRAQIAAILSRDPQTPAETSGQQQAARQMLEDLFFQRPADTDTVTLPAAILGDADTNQSAPLGPAPAVDTAGLGSRRLANLAASAMLPPFDGPGTASNAWVIAGSQTATGAPVLANDPHLGLQSPILWFLARVETPDWSIAGATVPGVPFHLIGHNGVAAWGFTTTGSDVQDLFIERIDPENPDRYLTPDGSEPFSVREETIRVRGEDPVTLTIRSTRHGPVISDTEALAQGLVDDGETVLSLAFTALIDDDRSAEALYRLNRTQSWNDFTDAMSLWVAPQQNIVYADTSGTTGLYVPGHLPIRLAGDGYLPVEGWHGGNDWNGLAPFDELPHVRDPERGWIVSANNRVVDDAYPFHLGGDPDEPYRARRIEDLIQPTLGAHTVEDSLSIQMDTTSLAAAEVLEVLLGLAAERTRQAEALSLLRAWSFEKSRDAPEPLIFAAWLREINRALFEDRLGPHFSSYWDQRPSTVLNIIRNRPEWCVPSAPDRDLPEQDGLAMCSPLLLSALDRALDSLVSRHGDAMETWRWGAEHVATLENQVLSSVPGIGSLIDLSVETDGGFYTINRGGYRVASDAAPFRHVHGSGLRVVYDLSDLDNSQFIIATGQSGNPLSDHYGNMVIRWRDGDTITISGDPADIAERGLGTLTLRHDDITVQDSSAQ